MYQVLVIITFPSVRADFHLYHAIIEYAAVSFNLVFSYKLNHSS